MTLESDVAGLTTAAQALTAVVASKVTEIDDAVDTIAPAIVAMEGDVAAFLVGAKIFTNVYLVTTSAPMKLVDALGNPFSIFGKTAIILARTQSSISDAGQIAYAVGRTDGTSTQIGMIHDNANSAQRPKIFVDGDNDLAISPWSHETGINIRVTVIHT